LLALAVSSAVFAEQAAPPNATLAGRYFSRADLDQMLKGIEVAAAASK
jgi:hypothetical protein